MTIEVTEEKRIDGDGFMSRVREMSCAALNISTPSRWTPCQGPIEAHHAGRRPGVAMKADDTTTIPLCMLHHRQWHGATGPFWGWVKAKRLQWADEQIERTQRRIWGAQA